MSSSAWFLVVSIVGAAFTLVALRPPRRPEWLMAFSFFSAWLTTELAVLHLAWQIVAVVLFVVFGALDSWLGWLGLAITLVSWFGLWTLVGSGAAHDRDVLGRARRAARCGLG